MSDHFAIQDGRCCQGEPGDHDVSDHPTRCSRARPWASVCTKDLHCFAQNDSLTAPGFAMRVTFYLTTAGGQRTPGDIRFDGGGRPDKELLYQGKLLSRSQVQVQRSGVRRGPGADS